MGGNIEELKSKKFYASLLAEFLGTLLLVFVGCGSASTWGDDKATIVQISLCFGLSVGTIVWAICNVSGGHINPAVTVALLFTRKITVIRALLYIVVQCIGAIVGACILKAVIPPGAINPTLGMTQLRALGTDEVMAGQGFGIELIITFVLVFTVFASVDGNRKDLNGSAPLAIGLSVTMCHLFAVPFTGASMNPARTLGPGVLIGSELTTSWGNILLVYWVAPIVGGILAGWTYDLLFAVNATPAKAKGILTLSYDEAEFDQSGRVGGGDYGAMNEGTSLKESMP